MKKYMNNPKQQFLLDYKNIVAKDAKMNLLLLVICCDISHSMSPSFALPNGASRIDELNKALIELYKKIKENEVIRKSLELSIITFGSHVHEVRSFAELPDSEEAPILKTEGLTMMAEGIETAVKKIRERYAHHLKNATANMLTPIVILLSDGLPTSSRNKLTEVKHMCRSADDFKIVPVGIGAGHNSFLHDLSDTVLNINDFEFTKLFEGLVTASISSIGAASSDAYEFLLKSALTWSAAFEN